MRSKPLSIKVVGFDGYEKNDPRQQEMLKLLELSLSSKCLPRLESLTPTSYPIRKGSIYAPIF
jgi:4-hydroxy 2-oxovalerate aldolase